MRLVVADTGPIRYLIAIHHIEVLPRLFDAICIPSLVASELQHPSAPAIVRDWLAHPPPWLEIVPSQEFPALSFPTLDLGESAALALGVHLSADLILIDDRKGADIAAGRGFEVTGTLGILDLAASLGLLDIRVALDRLRLTNFRGRDSLFAALLTKHEAH